MEPLVHGPGLAQGRSPYLWRRETAASPRRQRPLSAIAEEESGTGLSFFEERHQASTQEATPGLKWGRNSRQDSGYEHSQLLGVGRPGPSSSPLASPASAGTRRVPQGSAAKPQHHMSQHTPLRQKKAGGRGTCDSV